MQGRRQKNLVLILAREFASQLATPMFVTDAVGDLVFYNEPAEMLLGRTFAEAGELPASEWPELFQIERLDGSPMPHRRRAGATAREGARTLWPRRSGARTRGDGDQPLRRPGPASG